MAIIDLAAGVSVARLSLSVAISASSYTGFFTGNRQRKSHLADRLRATLTLPPCRGSVADERAAFLLALASTGDYLRMPMPQRMRLRGTMAGSPVVTTTTAAGARTLPITTTAGATLLAGDWIGVGGNLLQCAYAGAVADGGGAMSVPLVLPTQRAITAGAAVAYVAPTGVWELDDTGLQLDYSPANVQGGIAIPLQQVIL